MAARQELRGRLEPDDPTLTVNRIWKDPELAQEIVNRLTSEDIIKLLIFVKMDIIEANDDGSVTVQHHDMAEDVLEDVDEPKLHYDKEALLKRYNSGDVIVLLEPDVNLINTVRTDLESVSNNA